MTRPAVQPDPVERVTRDVLAVLEPLRPFLANTPAVEDAVAETMERLVTALSHSDQPATPFDPRRMTHAWAILTAETNPEQWEPDRYNAAAFVEALMAKYNALPAQFPGQYALSVTTEETT